MDIFVIYNNDGFIEGSGRVDQMETPDGSTMTEWLTNTAGTDPSLKILYLSDRELPDPEIHKIVNNQIVEMTQDEIDALNVSTKLRKLDILDRMTSAQQTAFFTSTDPGVITIRNRFFSAGEYVDKTHPEMIAGAAYLESVGILDAGEAVTILE